MFTPKSVLGILILTAALLPAQGAQLLFTTLSDLNLGVGSAVFGNSPYDVTAYGSCLVSGCGPADLYLKNDGSGETGLGLSDDASGEINSTNYVTFDFSDPEAHGVKSAQIVIDSAQSGEGWDIYGWTWGSSPLNGLASATLLTSISCYTGNTTVCPSGGVTSGPLTLPNLGSLPSNYRYFSVIASSTGNPAASVAVEEIDFGTAAPEPLSMLLAGCGLIALGLVRRRAR